MIEKTRDYDVIVDFWEWYQRREAGRQNPLASYALDKREEAFIKREWNRFGYWHAIYLRERPKSLSSPVSRASHRD
jgi:hypothetical protein